MYIRAGMGYKHLCSREKGQSALRALSFLSSPQGMSTQKGFSMEEQQIQDFVHRVSTDEELRKELARDPDDVIMRESFSPRVAQIMARLAPQLALDKPIGPALSWWW